MVFDRWCRRGRFLPICSCPHNRSTARSDHFLGTCGAAEARGRLKHRGGHCVVPVTTHPGGAGFAAIKSDNIESKSPVGRLECCAGSTGG